MKIMLTALALLLGASAASAETETFAFDPVHSRIAFRVSHAGFSDAIGTFSGISGSVSFDETDWRSAQVEARIPIDSLDLGDVEWRERVLDPTFFGVRKYPEARFVSTRVEALTEGRLRVLGVLDLHGVEQEIALDVAINRIARHPLTLRRTAGFSATATLSRAAFGMRKWKNLVGDEVSVSIEIEAQRRQASNEENDE
jgi:polyisoprenoid-binding protein YceI